MSARLLGGFTWQKAVGMAWRTSKPSEQLKRFWRNISILVVDECSMLSKKGLAQISQQFQKLKDKPGVPFGGVSVILHGDFFQLGPVGRSHMWAPLWEHERREPLSIQGQQLWNELDSAIFLEEDVRSKDPIIRKMKAACRNGEVAGLSSIINDRILSPKNLPSKFTSIANPDNKTRMNGNVASLVTHSKNIKQTNLSSTWEIY
eukprot:Lithocolla_globosa_v1_NODE_230_length_4989_cov_19.803405.p4 type:complete len:204 gc:universal NODE_230_length_4989_cov_19.803405:1399-2010(+)